MAALGALPDRDEPLDGRDEVDLLVEDAILVPDADGHEEDAEDVALVRLDPRARLVVVARGLEQVSERALVDLRGQRRAKLRLVGVEQVDPLGACRHAPRVRRLSC